MSMTWLPQAGHADNPLAQRPSQHKIGLRYPISTTSVCRQRHNPQPGFPGRKRLRIYYSFLVIFRVHVAVYTLAFNHHDFEGAANLHASSWNSQYKSHCESHSNIEPATFMCVSSVASHSSEKAQGKDSESHADHRTNTTNLAKIRSHHLVIIQIRSGMYLYGLQRRQDGVRMLHKMFSEMCSLS